MLWNVHYYFQYITRVTRLKYYKCNKDQRPIYETLHKSIWANIVSAIGSTRSFSVEEDGNKMNKH